MPLRTVSFIASRRTGVSTRKVRFRAPRSRETAKRRAQRMHPCRVQSTVRTSIDAVLEGPRLRCTPWRREFVRDGGGPALGGMRPHRRPSKRMPRPTYLRSASVRCSLPTAGLTHGVVCIGALRGIAERLGVAFPSPAVGCGFADRVAHRVRRSARARMPLA